MTDNKTNSSENTEPNPEDFEIWQTHIYSPQKEFSTHISVTVDHEDTTFLTDTDKPREIILTEGGNIFKDRSEENTPDVTTKKIVLEEAESIDAQRAIINNPVRAIGYYKYALEIHEIDKSKANKGLQQAKQKSELPSEDYNNHRANLTTNERKIQLLDYLEWRVENGDWAAEPYLEQGSWRNTNLPKENATFAERLYQQLNPNPQLCYRNAQQAAIKHKDNHLVTYVEGIMLPQQAAQAIRHSWIEYDNKVIELTLPWHRFNGKEAVYFGTEFSSDEVEQKFNRRNGGSPLALSETEISKITQSTM